MKWIQILLNYTGNHGKRFESTAILIETIFLFFVSPMVFCVIDKFQSYFFKLMIFINWTLLFNLNLFLIYPCHCYLEPNSFLVVHTRPSFEHWPKFSTFCSLITTSIHPFNPTTHSIELIKNPLSLISINICQNIFFCRTMKTTKRTKIKRKRRRTDLRSISL